MDITKVDLHGHMKNAVQEVFETMLSMDLTEKAGATFDQPDGVTIVGSVSFAGDVLGNVNIRVGEPFARQIAAGMLGMSPEELDGGEEINDVIGELSNMIGGSLKSKLCDAGFSCTLSIPSITMGRDFTIESQGWAVRKDLTFTHGPQVALVQAFIKSAN